LRQAIDEVEDALDWPDLVRKAETEIRDTAEVVRKHGKSDDRELAAALEREAREAIKSHEADLLRQKIGEITGLYLRIMRDQPGWWVGLLEHLEGRRSVMHDKDQADSLFNMARKAINSNDVDGLRSAVKQLLALLPAAQQQEISRGFGSTVIG
jgi:molecular chaperone DnaK